MIARGFPAEALVRGIRSPEPNNLGWMTDRDAQAPLIWRARQPLLGQTTYRTQSGESPRILDNCETMPRVKDLRTRFRK